MYGHGDNTNEGGDLMVVVDEVIIMVMVMGMTMTMVVVVVVLDEVVLMVMAMASGGGVWMVVATRMRTVMAAAVRRGGTGDDGNDEVAHYQMKRSNANQWRLSLPS